MIHDAVAFGIGEELAAEANEAAGRNDEFHAQIPGHFRHVLEFGLTNAQTFHDRTHEVLRDVNGQSFHWFQELAVFVAAHDNTRFTNLQFKPFTAHGFDQDGQMEFTTAGNLEGIWGIRILNTHGHVCFHFFIQAFTNMAACDEIPFLTGKRTVVDRKGHGQGRFVNFDASELFRISESAMVSPISTSCSPMRAMISPALASWVSTRFRPS